MEQVSLLLEVCRVWMLKQIPSLKLKHPSLLWILRGSTFCDLEQIVAHKKLKMKVSSSSIPPRADTSFIFDNTYLVESMNIVLERTSTIMTNMLIMKADSQLTRNDILK